MKLSWEPITLDLKRVFRTAHGGSLRRRNMIIRLEEGGIGEAAGVAYLGETEQGIVTWLAAAARDLGDDPFQIEAILRRAPSGSRAARAALDMALHDLVGQHLGQPLWRLWGLDPRARETSFTIGLDAPERMALQARGAGLPILKIKLGSDDDAAVMRAVREASTARLRVDVNGGWSRPQAARLIPLLADLEVELVEQPLPAGDIEGLRWLRGLHLGVPIFADESIRTPGDVVAHAGAVDGVVVKLMKSGGLREALRVITVARAHGMQLMMGCMVESSVGVTAAAHLAPLCDHVDLDGPLLVENDPFRGVSYDRARLTLPTGSGLGVAPR